VRPPENSGERPMKKSGLVNWSLKQGGSSSGASPAGEVTASDTQLSSQSCWQHDGSLRHT
jgi:hypothetical protein